MKRLLGSVLLFVLSSSYAAIYEQKANGDIIYSDTPQNNSQPVVLPNLNTNISLPPTGPAATTKPSPISNPSVTPDPSSTSSQTRQAYNTFIIIDPTNEETFQNQRDIPIKLKMDPLLQPGDKIQLIVDGKTAGGPIEDLNQLALHDIERGKHQLAVVLVDSSGVIIKQTETITIYIHYSAIPTGSGAVKATPAP